MQRAATLGAVAPDAVDPSALRSLAGMVGLDVAQEIVAVYTSSTADRVAAIRDGLAAGAPAAVRHAAHALKSSAGAVGATRVAELAAALEAASAAGWDTPPHAAGWALEAAAAESHGDLAAVLAALAGGSP